ncbi:hypothetical protein Q7O_001625 [Pectobacterium carotovorum subsp. carotovorum PCCS1]|nr:hypothetical protein [Pectobacterium carotovorum subsp. carotovorum PCCS1]
MQSPAHQFLMAGPDSIWGNYLRVKKKSRTILSMPKSFSFLKAY